ncbi:MAG: GIY-YIG nuclease family protein, partial [Chlorobi bacterium]|nr:GIY-YIG nuclease family protein [Chlorobiota bacterium]
LPKLGSKSLGNVARHLGIRNSSRHRAAGDCETTARVLIQFLRTLEEEFEITEVGELLSFQFTPVSRYNPPPHRIRKLKPKLSELPPVPGIYRFHDRNGRIIYVGKAKSLKDRVNSYFYSSGGTTRKVAELVRAIHDVTHETTETELSALLLESKEIKRLQPRFNTELKRYRKYPFLWIDRRNAFPTLGWTYEVEDDGAEYFGPFTSRRVVEATLDIINKLFLLRECGGNIHPDSGNSPCLYHGMNRCGAPCAEEQTPEEYSAEVKRVIQFLQGKHGDVLESLTCLMEKRSRELRFEAAAEIRDRLRMLRRVIRQQEIMAHSIREQNLLILTPALRTRVEVHLVKGGRVVWRDMIDQVRPKISAIMKQVERFFTNEQRELFHHTIEDINEMRIIATYCLSHREESVLLSINNGQPLSRDAVAEAIETVGRN